jgi:adenylate cyclase
VTDETAQTHPPAFEETPGGSPGRDSFAHVRHELRTPINAILGYSEMLLEDAEDRGQDGFIPDLQKIRAAGQKLLALINDLLVLDRAEAVAHVRRPGTSEMPARKRDREEDAERAQGLQGSLLIVDDNENNRDMLSRRLERQGHAVKVAENGRQALAMLRGSAFDLALLDIMMPEMDGYQVLAQMKADSDLRHIPVIMLSALDELDSVVRCIEMGAEDYLHKPFNPVLLRARIGACLEKKRLRDLEVLYLRQIEEEKRRADELLHVILPHEIVAELKATNAVEPRFYENVAVLFCDIAGFTAYCDKRQPEEVVPHLQKLVEEFEILAARYDMEEIKTIGDAFMATAGLLKPMENPVLNCVQCGLEMVAAACRLPPRWSVRVGIHVGPVIAGVVGRRKFLFDLWGDTVNTAAHLESHGLNDAVVVSETAWRRVAARCDGESLGPVAVKGKGKMEVFRVDGLKTSA